MSPIWDESGNEWEVRGGDPAAKFTNRLKRAGYGNLVLPMRTLATGELTEPVEEPADVLRRQRLADCLGLLKEG